MAMLIPPPPVMGYIAIELDLSSLRLQQYQEIFSAGLVLVIGILLSGVFASRLMYDVTRPITHMKIWSTAFVAAIWMCGLKVKCTASWIR